MFVIGVNLQKNGKPIKGVRFPNSTILRNESDSGRNSLEIWALLIPHGFPSYKLALCVFEGLGNQQDKDIDLSPDKWTIQFVHKSRQVTSKKHSHSSKILHLI